MTRTLLLVAFSIGLVACEPTDLPIPACDVHQLNDRVADLDFVYYNLVCLSEPHEGLTSIVFEAGSALYNSPRPKTISSKNVLQNTALGTEYNTKTEVRCGAAYDVESNQTLVWSPIVLIVAPPGPSYPVRNFSAVQDGIGGNVTLTWEQPLVPNGDRTHYVVRMTDMSGKDLQASVEANAASTSITITIDKPKFGTLYTFFVTPINKGAGIVSAIKGQTAIRSIVFQEAPKPIGNADAPKCDEPFPVWAIVLIVDAVLVLIGGGVGLLLLRTTSVTARPN